MRRVVLNTAFPWVNMLYLAHVRRCPHKRAAVCMHAAHIVTQLCGSSGPTGYPRKLVFCKQAHNTTPLVLVLGAQAGPTADRRHSRGQGTPAEHHGTPCLPAAAPPPRVLRNVLQGWQCRPSRLVLFSEARKLRIEGFLTIPTTGIKMYTYGNATKSLHEAPEPDRADTAQCS